LWNYFLTPLYMGMPREAVAEMLMPVFLPFNVIKGGINVALTILLYKHVVTALRKADLIPQSDSSAPAKNSTHMLIAAVLLFAVCIIWIFINRGIL